MDLLFNVDWTKRDLGQIPLISKLIVFLFDRTILDGFLKGRYTSGLKIYILEYLLLYEIYDYNFSNSSPYYSPDVFCNTLSRYYQNNIFKNLVNTVYFSCFWLRRKLKSACKKSQLLYEKSSQKSPPVRKAMTRNQLATQKTNHSNIGRSKRSSWLLVQHGLYFNKKVQHNIKTERTINLKIKMYSTTGGTIFRLLMKGTILAIWLSSSSANNHHRKVRNAPCN